MTTNSLIHEDAQIGEKVRVEPFCVIEDNVIIGDNVEINSGSLIRRNTIIGDNTKIGCFCIIGHPTKMDLIKMDHSFTDIKLKDFIIKENITKIGSNSIIRSGSVVYSHTSIGDELNTGHNAVIREHISMRSRCVIGTNTVLNGYSRIDELTRINTLCALPQSMRVGKGVFIAPHVTFSDNERALPGEGNNGAIIEDYVRIGIGANILPNITLHEGSMIGAGSVVTKDVPRNTLVYGVPAKIHGKISQKELSNYISSIERWV